MTNIISRFDIAQLRPAYMAAILLALVVLVLAWRAARRALAGRQPENVLTVVAAVIATAVAGTGMWRFFGITLGFSGPLRVLLFAFLEVSVFTSALRARRNVAESFTHSAGVDGMAVWALTGLSAVLSSLDARSFAEAVFRLAAPMVAAWLWERSMSVERRRVTGRAIHWRITPERILVRLGLAEAHDRTATEVDAHRRLTRVALAAQRLRTLRSTGAQGWRQRRAERRLDATMRAAIEHTGITDNEHNQDALLAQIGALVHARSLAEVVPPAPWAWAAGTRQSPSPEIDADRDAVTAGGYDPLDDTPDALMAWFTGQSVPEAQVHVSAAVPTPDPHHVAAVEVFAEQVQRGQAPGVREIKKRLRIGTDNARGVRLYLAGLAEKRAVPAER